MLDLIQSVLAKEFAYYKKLSPQEQRRFEKRVENFIEGRSFEGRKEMEVTPRMKILVSATAVQLTFGLEEYMLSHFDRIIIYPEKYYSPFDKKYHIGEAHTAGAIILSWKDFYEGILIHNDARNVGLHEFAHALMISEVMHKDIDDHYSDYYEKWYACSKQYLKRYKTDEHKFFRDYAVYNINEFLAVGTEYFFEASDEFKRREPFLFRQFARLYNQDTTRFDYKPDHSDTTPYFKEEISLSGFKEELSSYLQIIHIFFIAGACLLAYIGTVNLVREGSYGLIILEIIGMPLVFFMFRMNIVHLRITAYHVLFRDLLNPMKERKIMLEDVISVGYIRNEDRNGKSQWPDQIKIIYYDKGRIKSILALAGTEIPQSLYRFLYYQRHICVCMNNENFVPKEA